MCCILTPLLYSVYNHEFKVHHRFDTIVRFADDTVVINNNNNDNNETVYLEEVTTLSAWRKDRNLDLNVSKAMGMVADSGGEKRSINTPL